MLFDDPSSLWSIIAPQLLSLTPILLLEVAGMVVALVYYRRYSGPAVCVFSAFLMMFVVTLVELFLRSMLHQRVILGEWAPHELTPWFLALGIASMVFRALGLGLLVWAAFGWRGKATSPAAAAGISQAFGPGDPPPAAGPAVSPGHGAASFGTGPTEPISKGFYLGSIFGSVILCWALLIPGLILMLQRDDDLLPAAFGMICFGYVPLIYSVVMVAMLVYKLWDSIRLGPARTTPGKAVGFLFIPFFNLYWVFQAYWGWAVDFNQYIHHRGVSAARFSEGLALTVCILLVVSAIPYIGIPFGLINLVFLWIFFSRAITAANAVRRANAVGLGGESSLG